MKVEVYAPGGRELIGHYPVPNPRDLLRFGSSFVVTIPDENDGGWGGPAGSMMANLRRVALRIEKRNVAVDEHDIASTHWRSAHRIPDFAEELQDMQRHQRIYVWPVLVAPDRDVAELVFDLNILEPVGGYDGAAERDERWWMEFEGRLPIPFPTGGPVTRKMMVGSGLTSALTATAISADQLSSSLKKANQNLSFNIEQMKAPEQMQVVHKAVEAAAKGLRKSFEGEAMRRLIAGSERDSLR